MFPPEKVALLGVNSDPDPRVAAADLVRGWRSWWDGGTTGQIARDYAVVVYPTLFVIDQQGVIVARFEKNQFDQRLCDRVKKLVQDLLDRPPDPAAADAVQGNCMEGS